MTVRGSDKGAVVSRCRLLIYFSLFERSPSRSERGYEHEGDIKVTVICRIEKSALSVVS